MIVRNTNKRIYKQKLAIEVSQIIYIQSNSKILAIQSQENIPTIWYECNPSDVMDEIQIEMRGTGCSVPDNSVYIGTVQVDGFVWHYYIVQ